MPAGTPVDAIVASRFSISIGSNDPVATFTELTGIFSEVEPIDYYHNTSSGNAPMLSKLPGKFKAPTIVLKRGSDSNMYMWLWHEALVKGDLDGSRRDGQVFMMDTMGKKVAAYEFQGAWVSKMSLGGMKAGASEVLIEECTLTCEAMMRVSP
jgi:phage tail-like protein